MPGDFSPDFPARLARTIEASGSVLCVGIDPVIERLPPACMVDDPVESIEKFVGGVLEACAGLCAAVKFQSACFERWGSSGIAALERAIASASGLGHTVILDAKRGDIGVSVSHYAEAARHMGAHAVTAHAYAGVRTLAPFLEAGLGVFPLVRTSNPEGDAFQCMELSLGGTIAHAMAREVASLGENWRDAEGRSGVGAVVGVTKSAEASALRALMPDQTLLMPGLGAQGGSAEDITPLLRPGASALSETGVLVSASRSILYPHQAVAGNKDGAGDWRLAVRNEAMNAGAQLAAVCLRAFQ